PSLPSRRVLRCFALAPLVHCSLPLSSSTHPATCTFSTLSLHDALPISHLHGCVIATFEFGDVGLDQFRPFAENLNAINNGHRQQDRKSTRLNSSHVSISYAVFCLKKKKDKTDSRWRKVKNQCNGAAKAV